MGPWTLLVIPLLVNWHMTFCVPLENNGRHVRQSDRECCPCPKDPQSDEQSDQAPAASTRALDDCPCRPGDSDGASSLLFPNAMRAAQSVIRPLEEDPKPLLHPEVGLASSVLETLREATDEEYEDAVARDAARSAARALDGDDPLTESTHKVITIVLNPDSDEDDALPEATHVQETRCAHPSFKNARSQNCDTSQESKPFHAKKLTDILGLSKKHKSLFHKNLLDTDNNVGASNNRESFLSKDSDSLLKSPFASKFPFGLREPFKLNDKTNVLTNNRNSEDEDSKTKTLNLKRPSLFNKLDDPKTSSSNMFSRPLNLNNLGKFGFYKKNTDHDLTSFDKNAEIPKKVGVPQLKLSPNIKPLLTTKKPLIDLKNILKLKDVELIPLSQVGKNKKVTVNIPDIKLTPAIKRLSDDKDDFTASSSNIVQINHKLRESAANPANTDINKECIEKPKAAPSGLALEHPMKTEILDTIPSPSEHTSTSILSNNNFEDEGDSELQENNDNNESLGTSSEEQDTNIVNANSTENISIGIDESDISQPLDFNIDNCTANPILNQNSTGFDETVQINEINSELDSSEIPSTLHEVDDSTEFQETADTNISPITITESGLKNQKNPVRMEDLQNLSDSILNQSTMKEEKVANKCDTDIKTNHVSDESNIGGTNENVDDTDVLESLSPETTSSDETNSGSAETIDLKSDLPIQKDASKDENTCGTNLVLSRDSDTINKIDPDIERQNSPNEMTAEASENNADFLTAPLRQSIVQPSSLFGENTLNDLLKPPTLVLNDILNPTIPSLDDIRERITNFFNARESILDLNPSKSLSDLSKAISTSASTNNLALSSPLKEIDLDIFQVKPSTPSKTLDLPLKSQKPLSLNSYKARIAVPKSIDLDPLRLSSSSRDKTGMRTSTLTVRPSSTAKLSQSSKPKSSNLLHDGFPSIPSLDDIRDRLRENTENLLESGKTLLGDTIIPQPSVSSVSEALREHAENTAKNIQAALKPRKVNDISLLHNPLPDPDELMEAIARHHEDVHDKLKGIHYDLTDRLSSLRERIMESTNLPSLRPSNLETPHYLKPKPRLSSTANKKQSNKFNTPSKLQAKPRFNKENNKSSRPLLMDFSPSNQSPQIVKNPKAKSAPKSSGPVRQSPQILQKKYTSSQNVRNPLPHRHKNYESRKLSRTTETTISPLKSSNKKIQIVTPKPTAISTKKYLDVPKIEYKEPLFPHNLKSSPSLLFTLKNPETQIKNTPKSAKMLRKSPSDKPISVSTSLSSKLRETKEQNRDSKTPKLILENSAKKLKLESPTLPKFDWSKIPDSPVISKLREAAQARMSLPSLSFTKSKLKTPISKLRDDHELKSDKLEMARSPSENKDIIVSPKTLQENVPYKCKMVCNRE